MWLREWLKSSRIWNTKKLALFCAQHENLHWVNTGSGWEFESVLRNLHSATPLLREAIHFLHPRFSCTCFLHLLLCVCHCLTHTTSGCGDKMPNTDKKKKFKNQPETHSSQKTVSDWFEVSLYCLNIFQHVLVPKLNKKDPQLHDACVLVTGIHSLANAQQSHEMPRFNYGQ